MHVDVAHGMVRDESPEPTRCTMVDPVVVLVGGGGDHVEVTDQQPGPSHGGAEVVELGKEGNFVILGLGAVDACDPPGGECPDW